MIPPARRAGRRHRARLERTNEASAVVATRVGREWRHVRPDQRRPALRARGCARVSALLPRRFRGSEFRLWIRPQTMTSPPRATRAPAAAMASDQRFERVADGSTSSQPRGARPSSPPRRRRELQGLLGAGGIPALLSAGERFLGARGTPRAVRRPTARASAPATPGAANCVP
jgi:hypothetical protein